MKVILRRANVVSQSNKSAQPTTSKSIIGCAYGGAQLSVLGVVDLRIGLTRSYMIGDDIHHEVHAGAVQGSRQSFEVVRCAEVGVESPHVCRKRGTRQRTRLERSTQIQRDASPRAQ